MLQVSVLRMLRDGGADMTAVEQDGTSPALIAAGLGRRQHATAVQQPAQRHQQLTRPDASDVLCKEACPAVAEVITARLDEAFACAVQRGAAWRKGKAC